MATANAIGKQLPTGNIVGTTDTQTLTNKTLTSPSVTGAGTGTATLTFANTTTSTTATIPSEGISAITLVSQGATQTLTNKTLTTPRIDSIKAGGTNTQTFPTSTTTLVGRDTTDTLTNKTLSTGSVLSGLADESFSLCSLSRNAIVNGGFEYWLEATSSSPNDDTYVATLANFLTESNGAWTVARDTDVPSTKSRYSIKFSNTSANNQCGIVFFIETAEAKGLTGRTVSVAFDAKTTGGEISNLRCAVLSWTGTADTLTSDVISTWGQNGTNPTWATNWTLENTPANLALTNSWATYKSENIAIDTSSTNNIAVVIWVDDGTITAGDDFWIDNVTMNVGTTALPYQPRVASDELLAVQRLFEKNYDLGTVPGTNTGVAEEHFSVPAASAFSEGCKYKVTKRATPTVTIYSEIGTVNNISGWNGSTVTNFAVTVGNVGENGFRFFGGFTTGYYNGFYHWTADSRL